MEKKGSWLSALKKFFTTTSKDEQFNEKKNTKEKKIKSKHGKIISFFPIHREPSSIEKILQESEIENKKLQSLPPKKIYSEKSSISTASLRSKRHHRHTHVHLSATKIQAAYRGHVARKNYKTLKGLVRLQCMMRGQRVNHQTKNTMRCMQLLVKVQSQIQSRRIQMLERKTLQHQNRHLRDMDMESTLSKWSFTNQSEAERQEEWEDSVLTKEELNARMKRKQEYAIKRERALAYAQSHQLMKVKPKLSYSPVTIWWSWAEKQAPEQYRHESQNTNGQSFAATIKTNTPRLLNCSEDAMVSPVSHGSKKGSLFGGQMPTSAKQQTHRRTPINTNRSLCNEDSLASLSPYASTPSYMEPTISFRAKFRVFRQQGIRRVESSSKKRFSFGLAEKMGSMRWKTEKNPVRTPATLVGKHRSTWSMGSMSVDSTISLPVGFGRRWSVEDVGLTFEF